MRPKLLRDLRRLSWLATSPCRAALSTATICAAGEQMGRRRISGWGATRLVVLLAERLRPGV